MYNMLFPIPSPTAVRRRLRTAVSSRANRQGRALGRSARPSSPQSLGMPRDVIQWPVPYPYGCVLLTVHHVSISRFLPATVHGRPQVELAVERPSTSRYPHATQSIVQRKHASVGPRARLMVLLRVCCFDLSAALTRGLSLADGQQSPPATQEQKSTILDLHVSTKYHRHSSYCELCRRVLLHRALPHLPPARTKSAGSGGE